MKGDYDQYRLNGDRPISDIKLDEFGLGDMVSAVASGLLRQLTSEGYVIGIEGKWGSGKSSFVNFLKVELQSKESNCCVIPFEPWLIDNRATLLPYFFSVLAVAIHNLEPGGWFKRTRKISKKIWIYGQQVSKLAAPLEVAAKFDPSGKIQIISLGFQVLGKILNLFRKAPPSIEQQKADIEHSLRKFGQSNPRQRFVVIIDDIDRLEPAEAVEVLRLVAKVADFPLITYVLCFDPQVLAKQVETALKVASGREYLGKIIQSTISMPPNEAFSLRRFFREKLIELFPEEMSRSDEADTEYSSRKHYVLDIWAGRLLSTPRNVIRLCEAIKFGWVSLRYNVDFLDYVWLQMIRLQAGELYDWTRRYLSSVGAYRDNGRASDNEPEQMAQELAALMNGLGWKDRDYSGISRMLPGVSGFLLEGEKKKVFQFSKSDFSRLESGQRLGSPSHWRRYFAFSVPSYVISDDDMERFRAILREDIAGTADFLMALAKRPHRKPGHYVEYLFERLYDQEPERFTVDDIKNMAFALSEVMDDFATITNARDYLGESILDISERLLSKKGIIEVDDLFQRGKSINWLANVLRNQAAAYGYPLGREPDESKRWISEEQLWDGVKVCINRFRELGLTVFQLPEPLDILYCWKQLGDEQELSAFMNDQVNTDAGFLTVVGGLRSVVHSSSVGIYYPIRRVNVAPFFDPDVVKNRLADLAASGGTVEIREQASVLLTAWSDEKY